MAVGFVFLSAPRLRGLNQTEALPELLTDISCEASEDDSNSELDLAGSTGGIGAGTGQHAILT